MTDRPRNGDQGMQRTLAAVEILSSRRTFFFLEITSASPTLHETASVQYPHSSASASVDLEAKPEETNFSYPKSLPHEIVFVFVVCAAQLMTQSGLALSIAPLQNISASFNSTPRDLTWASSAYSLTVGTFIFVSGRLGDVYGHRLVFIIGFAWFGLWSLLAGFSAWSNPIFFDCCRAFQGIGPAFVLPNGIAILGRSYPPGRRKEMVFCLFGAVAPGGFILGAVFSTLLAQLVWWPWGYWIFAIACFMFSVLAFLAIPAVAHETPRKELSTWYRLDGPGAITGVSGLVLINFAWNQAAGVGWSVPYTYILLIVGIFTMALFVWVERKAAYPLLPRSAFKGETGWVLGCIAAGWSSFGVLVFYYYNIFENIEGNSGLLVTAKFSGVSASGACAAVITGFLLSRIRPSIIMLIAMVAFSAGLALLASMPIDQIYWANAFVIMLITPVGM